jgi:hypothetical protein
LPEGKGRNFPGDYDSRLKSALRSRGGVGPCHLTESDRGFVEGLLAAEVEGAQTLLELLDKHGSIELWEES